MNVTLLSGVVRNRKQMASVVSRANELFSTEDSSSNLSDSEIGCVGSSGGISSGGGGGSSSSGNGSSAGSLFLQLIRNNAPTLYSCLGAVPWRSICFCCSILGRSNPCDCAEDTSSSSSGSGSSSSRGVRRSNFFLFRRFNLRVHKFVFQWDLVAHLLFCIFSLLPFIWTGERMYAIVPVTVWLFYNVLFIISPHHSNIVIPKFGKLRTTFKATIEDFFSPKLLPLLSVCFLCVVLSLAATGHRLGGPPLCYQSCSRCLASWHESIPLPPHYQLHAPTAPAEATVVATGAAAAAAALMQRRLDVGVPINEEVLNSGADADIGYRNIESIDPYRIGCGYANGKEMLAFYTMAQTSFLLFIVVVVAMTVCLAWRIAEEEKAERRDAEDWLLKNNAAAHALRQQVIERFGSPADSSVRPEGNATWVFFGITAALTFTLLGWHNWYVLPPSPSATLLILLNLLTILMSTLILHVSFFGRLLALYKRNYLRVAFFTELLQKTSAHQLDAWWNCRNFVLNDDLAIDYDTGGLAVSATFMMNVIIFLVFLGQMYREANVQAVLEAPGSYCAYACLYITSCLIKLFTLATNTFEEQHRHIAGLQLLSVSLDSNTALRLQKPWSPNGSSNQSNGTFAGASAGATRDARFGSEWIVNDSDYEQLIDEGPIVIDDEEEVEEQACRSASRRAANRLVNEQQKQEQIDMHKSGAQHDGIEVSVNDAQRNEGVEATQHLIPLQNKNNKTIAGAPVDFLSAAFGGSALVSADSTNAAASIVSSACTISSAASGGAGDGTATGAPISAGSGRAVDQRSPAVISSTPPASVPALILPELCDGHPCEDVEHGAALSPYSPNKGNAQSSTRLDRGKGAAQSSLKDSSSRDYPIRPTALLRADSNSAYIEEQRNTIAEMIEQIRKYDPYPCILGIPVMPALFNTSKFYIFISFMLIGVRTMIACLRQI